MSMKELRSKSCKDGRMQIESHYYYQGGKPTSMHDLRRCYSSNPNQAPHPHDPNREARMKNSRSIDGGSGSKNWSLSDPKLQRTRRVASYRAYDVEGMVKGSLKKGLEWVKNHVLYGWLWLVVILITLLAFR